MTETILYNDIFNQTELLRTIAKLNKERINDFNTIRVLNGNELVNYVIMKKGFYKQGTLLSLDDMTLIIYNAFEGKKTYGDAKDIASAINTYRECIEGDILDSLESNLNKNFILKKKEIIFAWKNIKNIKIKMIYMIYMI